MRKGGIGPRGRLKTLLAALCAAFSLFLAAGSASAQEQDLSGSLSRIVNGVPAYDFPSAGALVKNGGAWCSGTLIGCRTFLTAAHCVEGSSGPSDHQVYFSHAGLFDVSAIQSHPDYASFGFPHADVAVLTLTEDVTGIEPMPLNRIDPSAHYGTTGTIVGFGQSGGNVGDYGLRRKGEVQISSCSSPPNGTSNTELVCWTFTSPVGPAGVDSNTCNGDSGGPLFMDLGAGTVVAGITSGGSNSTCESADRSYDANVYTYQSFIDTHLGSDATSVCGSIGAVEESTVSVSNFDGSLSSGNANDSYSFTVPAGALEVRVAINQEANGSLDSDLYVRQSPGASPSVYDCSQTNLSKYGACIFDSPAAGTWSIYVNRADGSGQYQVTATVFEAMGPDSDGDGVSDVADNCPSIANADQADLDSDGEGDVCDTDDDGDTVPDVDDTNPADASICRDVDADSCDDCAVANLPEPANDGTDTDSDGACNAGDSDDDGDGIPDVSDSCPLNASGDHTDTDGDGAGNVCDDDDDGDGLDDMTEARLGSDPLDTDSDDDGVPDGDEVTNGTSPVDSDSDDDGVADGVDNCPTESNADQADADNDDVGDVCDEGYDGDGDGVPNETDSAPSDPNVCGVDADSDTCDDCSDGDVNSGQDGTDTDSDGLCNAGDTDDDGDGVPDSGSGSFGAKIVIAGDALGAGQVVTSDVDGDGDIDAVVASDYDNTVAWFENMDGTGSSWTRRNIDTSVSGAWSVAVGDFDGDLDPDIAAAASWGDQVLWYPNQGGGTFGAGQLLDDAATGAWCVSTGDLDGDDDEDILSVARTLGTADFFENTDGSGSFATTQYVDGFVSQPKWIFAADIDGDNDLDPVVASYGDGQVNWYENDGNGSFGSANVVSSQTPGVSGAAAADLDGDGDMDLLSASETDNTVAWHENQNGAGSFGVRQVISNTALGANGVAAGDLDGDGDADVVSASDNDNEVVWYENDGSGVFSAGTVVDGSANDVKNVHLADVDGDGDTDILSASYGDATVAWYPNELAADNCPLVANADQADADGDGLGDACDPDIQDTDGDGVFNDVDNCPLIANASQGDMDGDGVGNVCDVCQNDANDDSDGDGSCDSLDLCEGDDTTGDLDADGLCGDVDVDDDGDGLLDAQETGTGIFVDLSDTGTDPGDADSDGDGFDDGIEVGGGSDPNDAGSTPAAAVPSFGLPGLGLLGLLFAGAGASALRVRRKVRR